jgi:hypothetical protein
MQLEDPDNLGERQDRAGGTEYDSVMEGAGTSSSVIDSMVRCQAPSRCAKEYVGKENSFRICE